MIIIFINLECEVSNLFFWSKIMQFSKLLLVIIALMLFFEAKSQSWLNRDSLGDNINFYSIQKKFNDYWGPKNIGHRTPKNQMGGWKAFKRWEWFWEQRVAPSGVFPSSDHLIKESRKWKAQNKKNSEELQTANSWTNLGPFTSSGGYSGLGRINWIEEDPSYNGTSNRTIWIGSPSGGLWKTTDDGASWTSKLSGFGSMGVSCIVINPSNSNIMYIATGDGDAFDTYSIGVLKSTDGGESWNTTDLNWSTSNTRTIRKIVMNANNTSILFAATTNGIYKTTDAGTIWTQVKTGSTIDIEYRPNGNDTLYASSFSQVFRTTNAGTNWTTLSGLPTSSINRIELAVSPNNTNIVYALFGYSGSNNDAGFHSIYQSTNGGTNWTAKAVWGQANVPNLLGWDSDGGDTGGQAWYDLAMAVSPTDANLVFVGGVNCWKSTNGGANWSISSHWWGDGVPAVHADHHFLGYAKTTSRLYNGNDGGIYRTSNSGTNWSWLGSGLPITQLYRIGASKTNSARIIAGSQDNGTKLLKSGTWTDAIGGDGMECIIDHTNADIMYGSLYYGDINKSTNAGSSFSAISTPSGESGAWVTPYVMHPTTSTTLYLGYLNVWKSTNSGSNWTKISTWGTSELSVLHVAPSDANYIYAGTGSSLRYTSNGGTNWTAISLPASTELTYLAINDAYPTRLYAVFSGYTSGNKVYYSTNAGANWTNLSNNLPNVPVNTVVHISNMNNRIFVGTDIGVFWRDDTQTSWQDFNTNLPDVKVTELEYHYSTNKLRAATYGRGLWEVEVSTNSDQLLAPILKSPSNNSTNFVFNESLIWYKSTNATSYGLQISTNSNMSNPIYSKTGLTDTTFVIKDTLLNYYTTYYWRTNAKKDETTSDWSTIWNFQTEVYATTPTQVEPTNNSTGITHNTLIKWNKVNNSQTYGLQVSVNSNMSNPIINATGLSDTTYTISDTIFIYSTTYYWRVNSKRNDVTSNWSGIWNFRMTSNLTAPTLTFPSNNATSITLTDSLKWNTVSGANKYHLLISTDQNFNTIIKNDTVTNIYSWLWNYNLKLSTIYYWKVLSMYNSEVGEWSSVFKFTTRNTNHQYCIPSSAECDEYIKKVVFNSISKESDCDTRYTDYSDYITAVTKGSVYSITITNGVPYNDDKVGVWFDWNQDGDFLDSGEFTQLTTSDYTTFSGNITIPNTATKGKTMMRVRIVYNISLNPCTDSDWGEVEDYSIYIAPVPLNTPTLVSPTNNAVNQSLSLDLNWNSVSNATGYTLQVSTQSDFSNLVTNVNQASTTYFLQNLISQTLYYWRVLAYNSDTNSNWSSTFNFTTLNEVETVTLLSPSNNSTNQKENLPLIWYHNTGITKYQVQISKFANFSANIVSTFTTDSLYNASLFNSTTFYWRARAIYNLDTSAWSSVWNFTTKDSLTIPILTTPANNATNQKTNLTLNWNDVNFAEKYRLQVSTLSNFSTLLKDEWLENNEYNLTNLSYNTVYYWRVLAADFADTTEFSGIWQFTTKQNLNIPVLASPSNNATNQKTNLTLNWHDVNFAEKYRLQVSTSSNFSTLLKDEWLVNSEYNITNLSYNTVYYWRVLAVDFSDTTAFSGTWQFTTKQNLTLPVLASPSNNVTNQKTNLTLNWNDVNFAEKYRLQVSSSNNFATLLTDEWLVNNEYDLTNLSYNTTYYWRVLAADFTDTTAFSGTWQFTTKQNLTIPVLTSPTNNATNQKTNLTLNWNDVNFAEKYRLQVSTSNTFSTLLKDEWLVNSEYDLSNLSYNTTYYWRVLAADFADTTAFSNAWQFTTKQNLTVPVLASPSNNATNQKTNLALNWNDVNFAEKYRLQVSTSNTFSTLLKDEWLVNSEYNLTNLSYNTVYYWRVLAADFADTTEFSGTWQFTTKQNLTITVLATPANNSTNQKTNLALNWNDVNYAEKYRLQVSTLSNFSTLLKDEWLVDSEYDLSNLSYNTTYYWRVLAVDFSDTTAFSGTWQFTTKQNLTIPVLATPANNATNQKTYLTLNWNDVNFAEKYRLQVSTSSNFSTLLKDEWLINSNYYLTNLSYNTTYYWRVLAADFSDTTAFSGTWQFTTKQNLTVPVLTSPTNNATNQKVNLALNWNDVNFAEKYRLQVSTESNFSTLLKDEWLVNSDYNLTNLSYNTVYYWRVLAVDFSDTTAFSGTWQFTTKQNLTVPVLVTPTNNATNQKTNLTLNWNDVNFAEKYRLQVSTSNIFSTLLKDEWLESSEYDLSNLSYNTVYYWRVLAVDFADTTAFSSIWQFTTKQNLTVPVLVTPTNNATNQKTNLTLNWNDVNFAEKYRLQVSTTNNFTTLLKDEWLINSDYNLTNLSYNTVYYWRVLAADFADTSAFSGTWQFTTKQNLTVPVLASPSNNATNQKTNLTLNWNDVNFAEKYRLHVSTSNTFATLLTDEWLDNSDYNLSNLSYNTTNYWRVLAADFADTTVFSGTWQFTTKQNLTVPVLTSPTNNATNQKVNLALNWNDVNFAEKYRLQVSTESNFSTLLKDEWLVNSEYHLTNLSYNTVYHWRVLAADFADTTEFSGTWQFTTKQNLTIPVLATPANNSTNQKTNLTLNWNDVNFAEKYRLQVSTLSNFSTLLKDEWLVNSDYNLTNLSYNTTYYWRVLAADFADTTAFSGTWQFTTKQNLTVPVLASPSNNATNQKVNLTLNWDDVNFAEKYRLQVSTSSNFSTLLKDEWLINSNYYLTNLSYNTTYYWRVLAADFSDTTAFSGTWQFTTKQNLTVPVLTSPTNNATNQKVNLALNWNDVNFAEKYRLQVSTERNFSTLLKDEWLVNSEYNLTNLSYNTVYHWRVLAADFADTTEFSGTWQFTTKQNLTIPVLATPANNSTNQKTNLTLNWNDVNFAEKYRLQVSTLSNFSTLLKDEWLVNSDYNLTNLSYNTTYYWRVLAADFADTTAFSGTWQFTTKQNLTVPVLASPSNNATNQKVNLTLNWDDVNFAEKYRLQVSTSNTFVTLLKDEWLVNSEYNLTNLSYNTTYYWRVLTADFADTTAFSATWQFNTKQNLTVPVLATPTNNATNQKTNLTLNWDDVNFAEKYRLQVSTLSNFSTLLKDEWLVNSEYNITNLSYNTTYYWRVLAADFSDTTAFSGTWQFTTKQNLTVPVLASPSNNATNQKTNLTLNWNHVNFAEKYSLQVSTSNNFSTLLEDEWLENSDYNLINLSYNTTYYWRVLGADFADTTAFSGTWQFTTKQNLTIPVLASPANNSTNQKTNLTLNWNDVNFAEKYKLQVSTLSNFSTLLKDEWLVNNEYNLTNLSYNTTYYWRVLAADFADTTAFSGTWQFTTKQNLTIPVLASPANNTTNQKTNLTLNWNDVNFAEKYRLQVSTSNTFTTLLKDEWLENSEHNLTNLSYNTTYYWRVLAADFSDTTAFSGTWQFTTKQNLTVPVLASPSNNATNQKTNLTLNWNHVNFAEKYRLQVSPLSNFSTLLKDEWLVNSEYNLTNLNYNTTYYWRVLAADFADTTEFSGIWQFTTKQNLTVPVLAIPTNNATNQKTNLTLNWNDVNFAEKYRLQVSTSNNFSTLLEDEWLVNSEYNITNLSYNTTYYWRVLAADFADTTAFSGTWQFTTKQNLTVPVLTLPTNNSTNQKTNLTLNWDDVNFVEKYRLQVSTLSNFSTLLKDEWLVNSEYNITNLSYNTTYYWRVLAADFADTTAFSGTWQFTTKQNLTVPVLVTPTNNATNQKTNLTLNWNDVNFAEKYRLQVSTSSNFSTLLKDEWLINSDYYLTNLSYYTTYYWRVLAADFADTSAFSGTWQFTTKQNLTVPVLASPSNNATNQKTNLTLNWNDVNFAEKYRLQVSTSNTFATLLTDEWLVNSEYDLTNLSYNTTYYWRVLAADFSDTTAFSGTWQFTTKQNLTVPVLSSPANNATNQKTNLTLNWNDVNFAESYRLQVSTSNTFTTLLKDEWLVNSDYNLTNLSYNTVYYWRVLAVDFADTTVFSGTCQFTTKQNLTVPVLASPSNNATNQKTNLTLNWNDVNFAEKYRLQVSTLNTFSTLLVDEWLDNSEYNLTNLSYNTTYYWRVLAADFADTTAYSGTWQFTTKQNLTVPVLSSPANNATNQKTNLTLNWNDVNFAEKYRLQVSTSNTFSTILKDEWLVNSEYDLTNLSYNTTYYWRVLAADFADTTVFSSIWQFTTKQNLNIPVLATPANNSTNQKVYLTLNWNDVNFAEKYRLQVSSLNSFATLLKDEWLVNSEYDLTNLSYNTTYYWRILAADFADTTAFSGTWQFTTKLRPTAPTLISIQNNDEYVSLTPKLIWNEILNAEKYHLQLASDFEFNNIVKDIDDLSINHYYFDLDSLEKLTQYYWRVNVIVDGDTSNWSQIWNFKTGNQNDLNKFVVTLSSDKTDNCNEFWIENNQLLYVTTTFNNDCGNEETCNFFNANDKLILNKARLVIDFDNFSSMLDSVKIYLKNNCGNDCSKVFLYNNDLIIDEETAIENGIKSLTLKNNNSRVTDLIIASCGGDIFEIELFTSGKYPNNLSDEWNYDDEFRNFSLVKIPKNVVHSINGRNFQVGDAIGVFYNDNGTDKCGGYSEWNGTDLNIIVWQDNQNTLIKDGFDLEEKYIIKLWDKIEAQTLPTKIKYEYGPYSFEVNAISELSTIYSSDIVHRISLNQGWNLISSYIIPINPSISKVFENIKDDVTIVKNSIGKIYIPSTNTNTIVNWNYKEAYQLYANKSTTLKIYGEENEPQNSQIVLNKGWSFIPYLRKFEKNITLLLSSIEENNNLTIVKNNNGNIYLPNSMNTIGNMKPGQGYQAYLKNPDTLIYSANYVERTKINYNHDVFEAEILKNEVIPTGKSMVLNLTVMNSKNSDEIGVWNEKGLLVGSSKIINSKAIITIWGYDEFTNQLSTAAENEKLTLKLLTKNSNHLIEINPEIIYSMLDEQLKPLIFNENEVLVIHTGINELRKNLDIIYIYPNPASDLLNIELFLNENAYCELGIYDLIGQKISTIAEANFNSGTIKYDVNIKEIQNGTYNIKLRINDKVFNKQFVIIK